MQTEVYRARQLTVLEWVESLGRKPNSRILEIGCGAGRMAVELARRGFQVHASDSVPAMVELARQHAADSQVGDAISMDVGDAYYLPFTSECFDAVIAVGDIPWLTHEQPAVREMTRVTKREGFIILPADNRWRLTHLCDPSYWLMPVLVPIKRHVKQALERAGIYHRSVDDLATNCHSLHRLGCVDRMLTSSRLEKVKGVTLGFGPFTVFGRAVLPNSTSIALHRWLQSLAQRGAPVVGTAGAQYIVVATRPEPVGRISSTDTGDSCAM